MQQVGQSAPPLASNSPERALRILHCISSVNPAHGGPIEGLKQVSGVHSQQGHLIEILSLDAPDQPWVQQSPYRCHAMGPGHLGNFAFSPRFSRWLRAHAESYDAVIVHGLWQYHSLGTWLALRGLRTPYFVFTHGMLDPWFKRHYPLKHLKKWLFWPWGDYRVLRDAKAVLFTCQEERLLARQSFSLYQCNEQVVSFGTAGAPNAPQVQRQAFLQRFPSLAHTRNLLFLGRVHEKKGADLLFQAWARLRQRRTAGLHDVRIIMAGPVDHPYGQAMQALAEQLGLGDCITWTGMLQGDEKWGAFRASDAFILPSHQENFGIAVAEALGCQLPVLITRQVNIWREIEASGAGWIGEDTVASVEQQLAQWLDTPDEVRQAMGQRAVACFQQHFHIDAAAASLIQAIRPH
jgi:glycosyltransferase involved in cell wall biosynthesis